MCWHRPGRKTKSGIITCRHCGVAIEGCPCEGQWYRSANPDCPCCFGSAWLAIVRGKMAKMAEAFEAFI